MKKTKKNKTDNSILVNELTGLVSTSSEFKISKKELEKKYWNTDSTYPWNKIMQDITKKDIDASDELYKYLKEKGVI